MTKRLRLHIEGNVQGVGFRLFTQEVARQLSLKGWVRNLTDGKVQIEVEGPEDILRKFQHELRTGNMFAHIDGVEELSIPPSGKNDPFQIY